MSSGSSSLSPEGPGFFRVCVLPGWVLVRAVQGLRGADVQVCVEACEAKQPAGERLDAR